MSHSSRPSTQSGESSRHSWPDLDAFPYTRNQIIQRVSSWLLATWHPMWKSPCGWLPALCGLLFLPGQAGAKASLCSHSTATAVLAQSCSWGTEILGLQPGAALRAHTGCWVRPAQCWMLGKASVSSWLGIESEVSIIGDQNQQSLWKGVLPVLKRPGNWNNIKYTLEDYFLRLVSLMFLFLINNYINECTGRYSSRKTSLFLGRAMGYLSEVGLSKQSSKRPQNCGFQFQILLIKTNKQKQAYLDRVWKCP